MNALPSWLTDSRLSEDIEPLLRQTDDESLERLAAEAQAVTLRRFGRIISLYAPPVSYTHLTLPTN